jgi:hypothetical protein
MVTRSERTGAVGTTTRAQHRSVGDPTPLCQQRPRRVLGLVAASCLTGLIGCGEETAVLAIARPESGGELRGLVRVEITTPSASAVALSVDGQTVTSVDPVAGSATAAWTSTAVPNGTHTLRAVSEGVESAPVEVRVLNVARADAIPSDVVKLTPELDPSPPALTTAFAGLFEPCEPLPSSGSRG